MVNLRVVILLLILPVFFFQNCSKTSLESIPLSEDLYSQKVTARLCFDGPLQGYTLESAIPVSLGLKPSRDSWVRDSDYDGISDDDEDYYGFNKYKSRSTRGILDSVCLQYSSTNDCSNLSLSCKGEYVGFGLSDCDTELSGIDQFSTNPTKGIDTDRDGIIDYIEFIRGSDPLVPDSFNDPDNDKRSNWDELLQGGNLNFFDDKINPSFNPKFSATKNLNSSCIGENWDLIIESLPWAPGHSVVEDNPDIATLMTPLTSEVRESLMILTLKIQSTDLSIKNVKFYSKLITLKPNQATINLSFNDFDLLGEVIR